jgi:hypothetical protein
MIRYALSCEKAHEFDGWFASSADFDAQVERGFVTCPVCQSGHVSKLLMAPSVATARSRETTLALAVDAEKKDMLEKVKEMVTAIKANSEDVGDKFPEEARKIHYGETDPRGIIGKATPDEVHALIEEGIGIAPLPTLPDDVN